MSKELKNRKKVAVFGGAGFLGSHVADVLTDRGYGVIVFDSKKSPHLKEGQVSVVGDITDQKAVDEATKDCQIVYNFAAIADIEEAKGKPLEAVKINILGNSILLEACRKNKVERFIFASTLYVYSNSASFYRSSKQACELLIENYREIYGLDYTILRFGSLYGPRAGDFNWIYKSIKQAVIENKITRAGSGDEIREYIHAYDAARLSVDILGDEYKNQHIIITGNQPIKVKDFMVMTREIFNNKIELEFLPQESMIARYEMTPYNFTPKLARRIQSGYYIDFGQGILDLIRQIHQERFSNKEKIKAIIFDFDGVILESADIKTKAFAFLFKDYPEHLPAILALHQKHSGTSRFKKFEIIYKDILKQPLFEDKKAELGKRFSEYAYQQVLRCPFVAGVEEFLEKYYQELPLFIASGTPEEEMKLIVKERGLERYFKGVFGSPAKKKDIIFKIMNDFQLRPEEVIFVGNSIDDFEGARAAGVNFIMRTKESNLFQELEQYV